MSTNKSNLPALPTASLPVTFTNNITKEDIADLIIAMEEEKLYKMRDESAKMHKERHKEHGECHIKLSEQFIGQLPKDQQQAYKNFNAALKILDPKSFDLHITGINIVKGTARGQLTNMLPGLFGLQARGNTNIRIDVQCDASPEMIKTFKRIAECDKLMQQAREDNGKAMEHIQDTEHYIRRVRAKVTAALLANQSPAEIFKNYTAGKMFKDTSAREENDLRNVVYDD